MKSRIMSVFPFAFVTELHCLILITCYTVFPSLQNALVCLLPQRKLGVADIVRIDNRGRVVWHIITMQ